MEDLEEIVLDDWLGIFIGKPVLYLGFVVFD